MLPYTIFPSGDSAITVELGNIIDDTLNEQVIALAAYLQKQKITGVKDVIPAYTTVTVVYDAYIIYQKHSQPYQFIQQQIEAAINFIFLHSKIGFLPNEESQHYKNEITQAGIFEMTQEKKVIQIPVCYDVSFGIDLAEIATAKGVSIETIIQLHTAKMYRVYMLGFLPGFTYMGTVDDAIATPRKRTPRLHIEAGSVGIAGEQTGIYPFNSPGGWNIIGRTPLKMFDAAREQPSLLQPGDRVQFKSMELEEYKNLAEL